MTITYDERPVTLADGTVIHLRAPRYGVARPAYGPLGDDVMLSPRVAPPMIGLGLLEAIPEETILANVDEDDADGDGVSGRAQRVYSPSKGALALGRFGWKAAAATVADQSAAAFHADMGLSTALMSAPWGDCTEAQDGCRNAPHGDQPKYGGLEIPQTPFDLILFYAQTIAPPIRTQAAEVEVLAGKALFHDAGCAACHTPRMKTAASAQPKALAGQDIWPYSDLLLHDMGEGLADGRPEGRADGQEWRTPPLWGLGRTEQVSGHTQFLHDGRARSVLEAILWHGGEAQAARDAVAAMPTDERAALIRFLESL